MRQSQRGLVVLYIRGTLFRIGIRICSLALLIIVCGLHQGCFVWRYTTTPPLAGRVLDANNGSAVVGAEVGVRKHEAVRTRTTNDGSFKVASDHSWGPAILIPFEFTLCGGILYVEAPGYETFEKNLGDRVYRPVQVPDVMLIKKGDQHPDNAWEPAPGAFTLRESSQ